MRKNVRSIGLLNMKSNYKDEKEKSLETRSYNW